MLYFYTYTPHTIEKMKVYVDFLMLHVWVGAKGAYSHRKLAGCPGLRALVVRMSHTAKRSKSTHDHLGKPIEDIYNEFLKLEMADRKKLKMWYLANSDIEALCDKPASTFATYKQIGKVSANLEKLFSKFFRSLYEDVLSLKPVQRRIGSIQHHYEKFRQSNENNICPFCGLHKLPAVLDGVRPAYDHYFNQKHYPFISVNFRNLAPMCDECNSKYKCQKDILIDRAEKVAKRRRAFYPFMIGKPGICINVTIVGADIRRLHPEELGVAITSKAYADQVITWNRVFEVEKRYRNFLLERDTLKLNLVNFTELMAKTHGSIECALKIIDMLGSKSPLNECNFILIPFIKECARKGLFSL